VPRPSEHKPASRPLPRREAEQLAEAIGAFAAASRLRLLWSMLSGERTVEELATENGLTQPATSQQLRVLREARLVRVRRDGRRAYYALHDHHVPELLAAIRHHYEHIEPGRNRAHRERSGERRAAS
jgi:ArsR family transcriptional regulator